MIDLCDYANSYLTFTVPNGENTARIQLDARCSIIGPEYSEEYFLITPCKSESMYVARDMWQLPNYDFCGIWSRTEYSLLRTYAEHQTGRESEKDTGRIADRFEEVKIDVRPLSNVRELKTDAEVAEATWANLALIARTHLSDEASGQSAVLEYPIKTMNVRDQSPQFQVDTGPVLWPDFGSNAAERIERLAMAFVAYNTFDYAEFIVRRPTPLSNGEREVAQVMHYSEAVSMQARHELYCVEN